MATKKKLLQAAAGQAGGAALNVEDVFSTYLYTGTGSSLTINNGVDLDGEGGLVWHKYRGGTSDHGLFDTERGVSRKLSSNNTDAQTAALSGYGITAFNSNGYTLGTQYSGENGSGNEVVSWTFRKAPKFFDVVTYTGNGTAGRTVSHNLGCEVGMIIVKATSTTGNWWVYHRSAGGTVFGTTKAGEIFFQLEGTNAANDNIGWWNNTDATSTDFTLGSGPTNTSGVTYVAYLFAHNDGDGEFGDGTQDIIKCGSYTGNSGGAITETLGFEPQWLLVKNATTSANWVALDNMRNMSWDAANAGTISVNRNYAEQDVDEPGAPRPEATGFGLASGNNYAEYNFNTDTFIYIAIRRGPMAVPESATDVFGIDTYGGTSPNPPAFDLGYPVDFGFYKNIATTSSWSVGSRLIEGKNLLIASLSESADTNHKFDYQTGWYNDSDTGSNIYSWMWRRAPSFFDVVAYKGLGAAGSHNHNLSATPEMAWFKARDSSQEWIVYHKDLTAGSHLRLNGSFAELTGELTTSFAVSDTQFTFANDFATTNSSSTNYIAYLFASLDGVSKVGSYTGTGSGGNQIDCGFSSGARFVLIKRTDQAGWNWILFDTERGIVSGNDPFLALNDTSAEVTSLDLIDPYSAGFELASNAGGTNASGGSYIFYAIA